MNNLVAAGIFLLIGISALGLIRAYIGIIQNK